MSVAVKGAGVPVVGVSVWANFHDPWQLVGASIKWTLTRLPPTLRVTVWSGTVTLNFVIAKAGSGALGNWIELNASPYGPLGCCLTLKSSSLAGWPLIEARTISVGVLPESGLPL